MRILQAIFGLFYGLGYVGNGIFFLYVEWKTLSRSFWQLFNPLFHLEVVITVLTAPLFWILLAVTTVSYFAMMGVEKHMETQA